MTNIVNLKNIFKENSYNSYVSFRCFYNWYVSGFKDENDWSKQIRELILLHCSLAYYFLILILSLHFDLIKLQKCGKRVSKNYTYLAITDLATMHKIDVYNSENFNSKSMIWVQTNFEFETYKQKNQYWI